MSGEVPLFADALIRLLLPKPIAELVSGDLEELWRTGDTSRLRYWRLAIGSIAAWWRYRLTTRPLAESGETRESKGEPIMSVLIQDIRYGFRMMRHAPAFTASVILTLALGIGVNAATFGMVDVQLLKPLNYRNPERVAFVLGWNTETRQELFNLPLADAIDLRKEARSVEDVAEYSYWSANLTGAATPERIQAYRVTGNTFTLLGAAPIAGRTLLPSDGRPDAPDVVVLSYGLWRRRFGGTAAILGQSITLDGHPHTVVGVMPARFEFPVFQFKGEAWTPLKVDVENGVMRVVSPSIVAIARLKPEVKYARAQAEIDAIMRRLESDNPQTNRGLGVRLVEMQRLGQDRAGPVALVLMGAVGFVLLLACANVANLLLSRASVRERELSVRAALGAGRGRLVRQLLTESTLLSVAGAGVGLILASWMLHALRASLPEILLLTAPNVLDLGIDRATLGFTAGVTLVSSLLFGTVPAFKTARRDFATTLRTGGHSSAGSAHQRFRAALMVAEVAMALVLLVAAGLLVRTFDRLRLIDPGFAPDGVLTMTVSLPEYRFAGTIEQRQFFERAVENIDGVSGIVSAAWVNVLPFSTYNRTTRFMVEGSAPEPGRAPAADYRVITPDYFRVLKIPVVGGRAFDPHDRDGGQPVAIVNRALARREFGGDDPIGRRIELVRGGSTTPWLTIVGVVGDVLHSEVTARPVPEIYVPLAQAPGPMMMLAARTAADPESSRDAVKAAIATVDPMQPVYQVKRLRDLVDAALLPNAAAMSMMAVFGALSLVLATVGIYAVISYAVSQQAREMGVRLALGAAPGDVMRLVLRRGLSLVLVGAAIGSAGALGVARLMRGLLYGVPPSDAPTYAVVGTLLVAIGAAACYVPARRATRLNPIDVLRSE